jgi:hypothetical protein
MALTHAPLTSRKRIIRTYGVGNRRVDCPDGSRKSSLSTHEPQPSSHHWRRMVILDRPTKLIRGREIRISRGGSNPIPVIGFELRCVGACPPCAVAGQRRLGQRSIQPGRDYSPGITRTVCVGADKSEYCREFKEMNFHFAHQSSYRYAQPRSPPLRCESSPYLLRRSRSG